MKTAPTLGSNGIKKYFTAIFLLLAFFLTPHLSVAQRDAGGQADGAVTQPCPISFKRNNGNGWGVCGGDSQIRVTYGEFPTILPQLTAILYTNTTTAIETELSTVMLPVDGEYIDKTQPYLSYCLTGALPAPGNSQGNIPPAVKLVLVFTYPSGQVCRLDIEEYN